MPTEKEPSIQDKLKAIREQQKQLDDQKKALKEGIPHTTIGKNRVEVSAKGAVSVYGMGRFPVTLYVSQLKQLQTIMNTKEFADFVNENSDKLAQKKEEKSA